MVWPSNISRLFRSIALAIIFCRSDSEAKFGRFSKKLFWGWTRGGSTASNRSKRLTEATMSVELKNMEYAVRGEIVIVADKITEILESQNKNTYPFDHIVYTNIGNPQSLGQKPLTWPRQVLALVDLPAKDGVDNPLSLRIFPSDAIERAKEIKEKLGGGGTGAYSHSQGARFFRQDIAEFIEKRDNGIKVDIDSIFMSNGASSAIHMILTALIKDSTCGVMIPTPQYPIYSATIDLLGGKKVGYFLDEKKGWDMNLEELEKALEDAKSQGINVNSFVLINPGNPTGQVLSKKSIEDVLRFCVKHNLVLLADEVYQENIYDEDVKFVSCKKAAYDIGLLENDEIELVSFHSTSKGLFGECGRRGGYMELAGIDPKVKDQLYKLASSGLCSCLSGQVMTSLMCRGPPEGGPSYESHQAEMTSIFRSLQRRSRIASEGLDSIPGFSCQTAKGSMYCFPSVELPQGAIAEAAANKTSPDTLYALSLLKYTGICVVPASGFGQEPGRFGFRTTFLPSEVEMERVVRLFKEHHVEFCKRYEN